VGRTFDDFLPAPEGVVRSRRSKNFTSRLTRAIFRAAHRVANMDSVTSGDMAPTLA
jgi:hypothetical protein